MSVLLTGPGSGGASRDDSVCPQGVLSLMKMADEWTGIIQHACPGALKGSFGSLKAGLHVRSRGTRKDFPKMTEF